MLFLDAADTSGDEADYAAVVYEQERTNTRELMSFARAATKWRPGRVIKLLEDLGQIMIPINLKGPLIYAWYDMEREQLIDLG